SENPNNNVCTHLPLRQNTSLSVGIASANLVKKNTLPSGSSARAEHIRSLRILPTLDMACSDSISPYLVTSQSLILEEHRCLGIDGPSLRIYYILLQKPALRNLLDHYVVSQ